MQLLELLEQALSMRASLACRRRRPLDDKSGFESPCLKIGRRVQVLEWFCHSLSPSPAGDASLSLAELHMPEASRTLIQMLEDTFLADADPVLENGVLHGVLAGADNIRVR